MSILSDEFIIYNFYSYLNFSCSHYLPRLVTNNCQSLFLLSPIFTKIPRWRAPVKIDEKKKLLMNLLFCE